MREKRPEIESSDINDQVKLKPMLGMRAGVWLSILYSIILIVILFFVLVLPGLRNFGSVLVLSSEPDGAALRVNGIFMGTSGDRIFVPQGNHTLEVVLPGFEPHSAVHEIPGRIFGSRIFPRRYRIDVKLETADPTAVFALAASDFAEWSFGGEPTAGWQIPLSLSEGAYRIGPVQEPHTAEILTAAARFAVTRAALRDLVRAKMLLDNGGLSPSPASLIGSVSDILVFLSENPGSAAWLSGLLPPESASILRASGWHRNDHPPVVANTVPQSTMRIELAGLSFFSITPEVMISETPVPRALYETFLAENPQWRDERSEFFSADFFARQEITGVSWYAALAFCQWLTERLPAAMAGMEVRLPTEKEWELGAALGMHKNNIWEWSADPFAPLAFIFASPQAIESISSPEKTLRGGPSSAAADRASLPPDFLSPVVTFRPVIAERQHE